MEHSEVLIVGSGPSAIAAAHALSERGIPFTILDSGRSIEPERAAIVDRLASREPQAWDPADVERIKEGLNPADEVPVKRAFGSDFAFDTTGSGAAFEYRNAGLRPTFASGGLSNLWGAGLLEYSPADLAGWPLDSAAFAEPYRRVLGILAPEALPASTQAQAFLADARRAHEALSRDGISVRPAELAVTGSACRRCGLCLYGCPYGLIYNSRASLERLLQSPGVRYEPGFAVTHFKEAPGRVTVEGHDWNTGAPRAVSASRVLLAAGPISSAAILLRSLGEFNVTLRLLDSSYFLLPLLRFRGAPNVETEALHTLAQAFISLRSPEVSPHAVHFSIYGYNDLLRPAIEALIRPFAAPPSLLSRLLVAGGYLHSSESPGLGITLQQGRVVLEGDSNEASAIARRAAALLMRHAKRLRAVPLTPAMRIPAPGRGFHSGGSFPMSARPGPHQSDLHGRPYGFDRIHLIDSSCLPSIPAGPITLSVMANAWRIASLL